MMNINISAECPLWPNKPDHCTTILAVQKIFASFSLIGCLFLIIVIIVMKMYRDFVQKLILSLAISGFFESISYLIHNVSTELNRSCRFQAFTMQYFGWSTLLWVLVITLYLLSNVLRKELKEIKHFYLFLHCFVWLLALFWAVIPLFGDKYGPAGIWCWIQRDYITLRFGVWYVPLLLINITMLVIYGFFVVKIFRDTKQLDMSTAEERNRKKFSRKEFKPLVAYPVIFMIFYIPGLMYRIEDAVHDDKPPNFAFAFLSAVFIPSIGAFNAIFFTVYNASKQELSWLMFKASFMSHFRPEPTSKHDDYPVTEEVSVQYQAQYQQQ